MTDRIADLIEAARMREIEIDRDTRKLADRLGNPLLGMANEFGLTPPTWTPAGNS